MRLLVVVILLCLNYLSLGQVVPQISISSSKSTITTGDTIVFKAVYSGGGLSPKLQWKKNGLNVGTNSDTYIDKTLNYGDKIACVLTSNDSLRVLNVVASNFLSPNINPLQIKPILNGKGLVGEPIILNSNQTQQIIWRRNGNIIKNPIKDLIKTGITIAGSPERTTRILWPNGIFIDENDDIYIADTYNNRILKQNFKSGLIEVVAGGNGSPSLGSPGQSNQTSEPNDVVKDKNGNLIIAAGGRIQIWEPGSISGKTIISKSTSYLFLDNKNNLYFSNLTLDQIEKYNLSTLEGEIVAGGNGKGSKDNQLNNPAGIFVDNDENIYVVDNGNYRIQKWAKNSKTGITIFGGKGSGRTESQLYYPTDIHIDKNHGILIADSYRVVKCDTIRKIGTAILGSEGYGIGSNNLWHVKGVSVNSKGEMFVTDAYNNRLQKKNLLTNIITTQIGGDLRKNELFRPSGIAIDKDNSIYVSDYGNNRIQKFSNNSEETIFPLVPNSYLGLSQPYDLHIDSLKNLYVADASNNRILKIDSKLSTGSIVAGGNGRGNQLTQLNYPRFFTLSKSGNLYISDFNNDTNRIVKWNINSLQGNKIVDGKSLNVTYFNPSALFVNKNEDLYFGSNYAIYKLPFNSKVPMIVAGNSSYGFGNNNINYASSIVVDDEENIFFLDNNQVKKWIKNAKSAITLAGDVNGGNRSDQLSNPQGLKFDNEGNIYVSDTYNHRVQKFVFENNSTLTPVLAGEYSATIITQFGEFTTPTFKVTAPDTDKDGIEDALDKCPNTPVGESVDANGCSLIQKDSDKDGVNDKLDKCPDTTLGNKVDENGCANNQKDTDKDGITDDLDKCPETPVGTKVDKNGCSEAQLACQAIKPVIILKNGIELSTSTSGISFIWYLDDNIIPSANGSSYFAIKSGKYSVKALSSPSCVSSMSEYQNIQITGTNENELKLNISPNPFSKSVVIEFPISFGPSANLIMYDLKGSTVYIKENVQNKEAVNLSHLTTGAYVALVSSKISSLNMIIKLLKE
ncbi:thrombospondin type 3 repeat-containing protein [Aquirufa nivalisilvae]